jgi:hypothetical protein
MIGKRLLQLLIHGVLCVVFLANFTSVFFDSYVSTSEIVWAVVAFVFAILLSVSVRLNWLLLRPQSWKVQLPRRSLWHFVVIPVSAFILYFSAYLNFGYDDHLSIYALGLKFPERFVDHQSGNDEAGIAGTPEGICLFLIYGFVFMFLHTLNTLGLFSHDAVRSNQASRVLYWAQLALGAGMMLLMLAMWYRFYTRLEWFIVDLTQHDGGLLNSWNIGRHCFQFLNLSLLQTYALWVLRDARELYREQDNVIQVSGEVSVNR